MEIRGQRWTVLAIVLASVVAPLLASCGGDESAQTARNCESTYRDSSEHSAEEYEQGCLDEDGELVTFERVECTDGSARYLADRLGSGRPDGAFFLWSYSTATKADVLEYCLRDENDPAEKTAKAMSDYVLAICAGLVARPSAAEAERDRVDYEMLTYLLEVGGCDK